MMDGDDEQTPEAPSVCPQCGDSVQGEGWNPHNRKLHIDSCIKKAKAEAETVQRKEAEKKRAEKRKQKSCITNWYKSQRPHPHHLRCALLTPPTLHLHLNALYLHLIHLNTRPHLNQLHHLLHLQVHLKRPNP